MTILTASAAFLSLLSFFSPRASLITFTFSSPYHILRLYIFHILVFRLSTDFYHARLVVCPCHPRGVLSILIFPHIWWISFSNIGNNTDLPTPLRELEDPLQGKKKRKSGKSLLTTGILHRVILPVLPADNRITGDSLSFHFFIFFFRGSVDPFDYYLHLSSNSTPMRARLTVTACC